MRHGLSLGELGTWFVARFKLDVAYRVIEMEGWQPHAAPGFGWPNDRIWINPSPNAPNLSMARCYAGTVMLEGTHLSEGRGTTRPLELFGAPDIEARALIAEMQSLAPEWLKGCFKNMQESFVTAFRFTPKARITTTTLSNLGACRRLRSKRSAVVIPNMICGAISHTSTSMASASSISSMAVRSCAPGSTTRNSGPPNLKP
jgi:hypothetical protein